MKIGLFTREGKHQVGRIGNLVLTWDRHAGGKLGVSYCAAGHPVPIGFFTISAVLEEAALCSAADPDPRLIAAETGPHRLALRAVQRLCDGDGVHLGDAMQETWAWSDGSLYLNAMLRLIDPSRAGALVEAGADLEFAPEWTPVEGAPHRFVHPSGYFLAVVHYGEDGPWAVPLAVEDPWEGLHGQPPFYRRWGPYYAQWGGAGGWASAALADGPVLRAQWTSGGPKPRQALESFRGTLALLVAADEEALARKVRAFERPPIPLVEGGEALYYSPMEGTIVVRKTGERLKLTFAADADHWEARVHICGVGKRAVLKPLEVVPTLALPLAGGDVADDPNGPNLLRPDDRHGPIITDADAPPDEVLTTIPLAGELETQVEWTTAPGLQLACQKWDDRHNLLLFSAAHPQGNTGALCLRDLKMRDLKIPGYDEAVMALLPLYWFQANASSAHHCLNQPKQVDLIENGPDLVHLRVVSQNPAATALSEIEVYMPFFDDRLRFDMVCRFTALETWDLPQIQYCNFFPEGNRTPGRWNADRVLVLAADGQRMRIDHRAAGADRVLSGAHFQDYEGALFVALYGGPMGSILALSRPRQIRGAKPGYQLCPSWLDNHLFLSAEEGVIAAGTRYEVELSLVLTHTTNVDGDIEALGRQALTSGVL